MRNPPSPGVVLLTASRESLHAGTKSQGSQKINEKVKRAGWSVLLKEVREGFLEEVTRPESPRITEEWPRGRRSGRGLRAEGGP